MAKIRGEQIGCEKMAENSGTQAGTKNEIYDLVAVLHQTLEAIADCDIYIKDAEGAEDAELIEFFTSLRISKSQIAEKAQQLLARRI
jgi:hypothetical protein